VSLSCRIGYRFLSLCSVQANIEVRARRTTQSSRTRGTCPREAGIVTGIGATVNPYIEYYADNLPERRLGAFGIGLIFCGFALQSLQYWLTLFDVHLT